MGNSVLVGTPGGGRTITYQLSGGDSISLNYVNVTYSIRYERIGRQQTRKVYRFSFRFVIAGDTASEMQQAMNNAERMLSTRGGTLSVYDSGVLKFLAQPAGGTPPQLLMSMTHSTNDRNSLLYDVEWGPHPVSFQSEGPLHPISTSAVWVVDVVCVAEDVIAIKDTLVSGIDAEVTYQIDQNHYTRRVVTGRVHVINFGRLGITLGRSPLSQADMLPIREAILAGPPGQAFMNAVRIPPNFIRVHEAWHVDATENMLHFTIVDQERYRLFPAYITDAQVNFTTAIRGVAATNWFSHRLSGSLVAPRDVSKTIVLSAFYEILQTAFSFLFRNVEGQRGAVTEWSITNDIYDNRISFNVVAKSPFSFQNVDLVPRLGIANYSSEVFFPQGPSGTAGLFGSAYRLESFGRTTGPEGSSEKIDPSEFGSSNDNAASESAYKKNLGDLISCRVYIEPIVKEFKVEANPNDEDGESEVYQTQAPTVTFKVSVFTTHTFRRGNDIPDSAVHNAVADELEVLGDDYEIISSGTGTQRLFRSPAGPNDIVKQQVVYFIRLTGSTKKDLMEKGDLDRYTQWVRGERTLTSIEDIDTLFTKFFTE